MIQVVHLYQTPTKRPPTKSDLTMHMITSLEPLVINWVENIVCIVLYFIQFQQFRRPSNMTDNEI